MSKRRWIGVIVCAMVAAILPAMNAGADGSPTVRTQTIITSAPATERTFSSLICDHGAADRMGTFYAERQGYLPLDGTIVWRFRWSGTWCYNPTKGIDGKVTAVQWNSPTCWTKSLSGWDCVASDEEITDRMGAPPPSSFVGREWTGHFRCCGPIFWAINKWPWLRVTLFGNGVKGIGTGGG